MSIFHFALPFPSHFSAILYVSPSRIFLELMLWWSWISNNVICIDLYMQSGVSGTLKGCVAAWPIYSTHSIIIDSGWHISMIDRYGSPTEEPSGGGRRSSAIKGGQWEGLPVRRPKLPWPRPSTRQSITISTAAVQV